MHRLRLFHIYTSQATEKYGNKDVPCTCPFSLLCSSQYFKKIVSIVSTLYWHIKQCRSLLMMIYLLMIIDDFWFYSAVFIDAARLGGTRNERNTIFHPQSRDRDPQLKSALQNNIILFIIQRTQILCILFLKRNSQLLFFTNYHRFWHSLCDAFMYSFD